MPIFEKLTELLKDYHNSSSVVNINDDEDGLLPTTNIEDNYGNSEIALDSNTDKYKNPIGKDTNKYIGGALFESMRDGKMENISVMDMKDVRQKPFTRYYNFYKKNPKDMITDKTLLLIGQNK